jgi:acetylglutamate kinase
MKSIVIKFGGAAMTDRSAAEILGAQLRELQSGGYQIVLVHGGGPEIDHWLGRLGIEVKKIRGLRVTDPPTMDVVEMVLAGRVNKSLVSIVGQSGGKGVGLSLRDGGLARCSLKFLDGVSLGQVGAITSVDSTVLRLLLDGGFLPVVCSVGESSDGTPLNVNADEAAAALAVSIKADLFVLLTDVPGILAEYPKLESLIPVLKTQDAEKLIANGAVEGGMIPKVEACLRVIRGGVGRGLILDGRNPNRIAAAIRGECVLGTEVQP